LASLLFSYSAGVALHVNQWWMGAAAELGTKS
jgi:hypothetical protein